MTATEPRACTCGTTDGYHWADCALVDPADRHAPDCRISPCTCHVEPSEEPK